MNTLTQTTGTIPPNMTVTFTFHADAVVLHKELFNPEDLQTVEVRANSMDGANITFRNAFPNAGIVKVTHKLDFKEKQ